MYKHISANKRNTFIIMAGFIAIIALIGLAFALTFDDYSIFIWVFVVSAGFAVFQYFAASKLATMMTGAKEIQKKDNPRLYNIVENLSIQTGLPMPKVYVIDDPAPNAFASGRDPKHALVAATTGLMDIMNDDELNAIMAHEISHVKNYDIRVSTIVFGLVSLIGLLSDIGTRMLIYGGNRGGDKNSSPVGLIIMIATAILAPIAASLAQMAVSRQREYLADSSAVLITRYPEGMISALKKLGETTRPMRQQNPATSSLFITNPLKKGSISSLFSTHPPIEKRIARLENGKKIF
jgi:heat shock protein HtpX